MPRSRDRFNGWPNHRASACRRSRPHAAYCDLSQEAEQHPVPISSALIKAAASQADRQERQWRAPAIPARGQGAADEMSSRRWSSIQTVRWASCAVNSVGTTCGGSPSEPAGNTGRRADASLGAVPTCTDRDTGAPFRRATPFPRAALAAGRAAPRPPPTPACRWPPRPTAKPAMHGGTCLISLRPISLIYGASRFDPCGHCRQA
jgi:hypothetical protein